MYASKLQTERSPVAKCVMIAEANTDAPKSFCDAPDGTGHRDMARFLTRKSQRYYRLKFADTYYGEMTHYGLSAEKSITNHRRRAQKTPREGIDKSRRICYHSATFNREISDIEQKIA